MRNYSAFLIALVACAACTTFTDFKRVGTYTYEGADYDVYTARREDYMIGTEQAYVVVPKGVEPAPAAVVATCSASGKPVSTCEESFGKQIAGLTATPRDEGGMY